MKSILSLLTSLCLFCSPYKPVESVRPLQATDLFGDTHTICTTESINAKDGYWLSANHCALATGYFGEPLDFTIAGEPAYVVAVDGKHDAVIFKGRKGVPALRFASHAPHQGDEIFMLGYPIGIGQMQYFWGHIASTRTADERKTWVMLFDIEGCHGNSGSAVLNKDGEVVSVLQFLVTDYDNDQRCGHWLGGLQYSDLIKFVQGYAENAPRIKS